MKHFSGSLLRLLLPLAVCGALLALDLASKTWAESELRRQGARGLDGGHAFDSWLALRYQANNGIAFGLFSSSPSPGKRALLIAYSASVTAALAVLLALRLRDKRPGQPLLMGGLVAMLAGAAGNLRDRVTRGAVTDFIDVGIPGGWRWPTFNLADAYLAVGLLLGLAALARRWRGRELTSVLP